MVKTSYDTPHSNEMMTAATTTVKQKKHIKINIRIRQINWYIHFCVCPKCKRIEHETKESKKTACAHMSHNRRPYTKNELLFESFLFFLFWCSCAFATSKAPHRGRLIQKQQQKLASECVFGSNACTLYMYRIAGTYTSYDSLAILTLSQKW